MAKAQAKITQADINRIIRKECEAAVKAMGGISVAEIEQYRRSGHCEICKRPNGGRLLCRDHHHVSKKFRGLLCIRCNLALGLIKDIPETCEAMAEYLRRRFPPRDKDMINFES